MVDTEPDRSKVDIDEIREVSGGEINVAGKDVYRADTIIFVNQVGQGLHALENLVQVSPEVREAAIVFRNDFEKVYSHVDLMGDYKDLHDLLHQVQFHCYIPIQIESSRFPNDMTLEALDAYQVDLREIQAKLSLIFGYHRISEVELTWIQEIALIQSDLLQAIDLVDEQILHKAIHRLGRLLSIQPSRINSHLSAAAQDLPLDSLLEALLAIEQHLNHAVINPQQIAVFRSGLSALKGLKKNLVLIVRDHDQWQIFEVELHRIEEMIRLDLAELEFSWDDIKVLAEPLYKEHNEEWAVILRENAKLLDKLLITENPYKVKRVFQRFRREAGSRFFQIDLELKRLCDELRQVGGPLSSVLGRLG